MRRDVIKEAFLELTLINGDAGAVLVRDLPGGTTTFDLSPSVGEASSLTTYGPSNAPPLFVKQHSDDSFWLIDPDTGEASRGWSYGGDECLLVVIFGEANRLANGNTLVIFSSSGQVSETTPEGETVWQINLGIGGAFGFGGRQPSLYTYGPGG